MLATQPDEMSIKIKKSVSFLEFIVEYITVQLLIDGILVHNK